jgi:DNA repair photolyase
VATSPNLRAAPVNPVSLAGSKDRRRRQRAEDPTPSLFPSVPLQRDTEQPAPSPPGPAADLVGIARLAAASPLAESKRGTEYFLLPVRSILNHCDSDLVPFSWTVNPYRGCEFGCRYCYARYTHEYMELDAGEFERKIYVKQDAGALAARDLASEKVWGEHIAIGTATDPYQPAEREFGATRAILEQMATREGLSVSITTKSNQVVRDLELLRRIAARSALFINITVTTLRPRLARLLEPRAPRPDLRLAAVRALADAGLAVGVFAMPVLPGLTDREADLDALASAARDAGAQWLGANVLFLMPSAQKQFLPFMEKRFPRLARQYRDWYAHSGYAPEEYRRKIDQRIAQLRAKYGLSSRPYAPDGLAWRSPQLPLAWPVNASNTADGAPPQAAALRSCACAR